VNLSVDSSAAQASFTEITFGLNIAFAYYFKGREVHALFVDRNTRECRAIILVAEQSENLHADEEKSQISRLDQGAKERQRWLTWGCTRIN
jgi:hypothetical protein